MANVRKAEIEHKVIDLLHSIYLCTGGWLRSRAQCIEGWGGVHGRDLLNNFDCDQSAALLRITRRQRRFI